MDKIWEISSYQEKNEEDNNKEDVINRLLSERGINSRLEKNIYLNSELKYLSDPFLLSGMTKAVKRIKKAVKNKENILIYGDYDVDGITSTAVLYRFFKKAYNLKLKFFLPDRIKDGYGLNLESLKKIIQNKIDLIITVDCGITGFKEAEYLRRAGVDLIITDHHTPSGKLPTSVSVINHHLVHEKNYFAANIAGVGTAFKLTQALDSTVVKNMEAELLPIVALGTVADIAPLKDENRILVKNGLELINKDQVLGLKTLIEELKIDKNNITAGKIGFIIAPPLNAAGRISDPEKALRLLITEQKKEAKKISKEVIEINKKRQKREEKIYESAEKKIKKLDLTKEKSIILADSNWHSGIIGIVASRLLEKYNVPVILFAIAKNQKTAKGSARSIAALNIYETLKYCQTEVINFGGHKAAAGLSINLKQFSNFKKLFQNYLFENLKKEDYLKRQKIDLNLKLSDLNKSFISSLDKFRPFGIANPAPKFIFRNLKGYRCYQMGKKRQHLKIYLKNDIQAIAFNMGDQAAELSAYKFDLIAKPEINHWQGNENIQLKVEDYRLLKKHSTALVFKKDNFSFYDFRNTKQKKKNLSSILDKKVLDRAAVYINYKKDKNYFNQNYSKHCFSSTLNDFQSNFSHLVLYSLPFSLDHFYSILESFQKNNKSEENKIIFLFSQADISYNKKLIKHFSAKEKKLKSKNELDFKGSIRYNKLSRRRENFIIFKNLIFKNNLFNLLEKLSNFKEDKNES